MKVKVIQIFWHDRDPILSVDFHWKGYLASAGADKEIKFWNISVDKDGMPTATYLSSCVHHNYAVNIIRFDPTGEFMASGADGGEILLWKHFSSSDSSNWKVIKSLRSHERDVLDIEWSFDSTFLVSGSVDNSAIIWDADKGIPLLFLQDHIHYVQGVAFDPLGNFVVTQSGDRTCRIYSNFSSLNQKQKNRSLQCQYVLSEFTDKDTTNESGKYTFYDENMRSFFRRLSWSPDGSFLVIPAGLYQSPSSLLNTSFIFSRSNLSKPLIHLPVLNKPVVVVKFCPKIFYLSNSIKNDNNNNNDKNNDNSNGNNNNDGDNDKKNEFRNNKYDQSVFKLPYKFVFAIATLNSVFLYDTEQTQPIAILCGLHYAAITDIAWSPDAKNLVISSQDGYCTVAVFDEGELGKCMPLTELPAHISEHLPQCIRKNKSEKDKTEKEKTEKEKTEKDKTEKDKTEKEKTEKEKTEKDKIKELLSSDVGEDKIQPSSNDTNLCENKNNENESTNKNKNGNENKNEDENDDEKVKKEKNENENKNDFEYGKLNLIDNKNLDDVKTVMGDDKNNDNDNDNNNNNNNDNDNDNDNNNNDNDNDNDNNNNNDNNNDNNNNNNDNDNDNDNNNNDNDNNNNDNDNDKSIHQCQFDDQNKPDVPMKSQSQSEILNSNQIQNQILVQSQSQSQSQSEDFKKINDQEAETNANSPLLIIGKEDELACLVTAVTNPNDKVEGTSFVFIENDKDVKAASVFMSIDVVKEGEFETERKRERTGDEVEKEGEKEGEEMKEGKEGKEESKENEGKETKRRRIIPIQID